MKLFFAACVVGLGLLSAALYFTESNREGDVPILTWITQNDENKREIVDTFHQWLKDENLPMVELRIDNTNQDATKKLVQGVSGVGADILDLYVWELDLFPATGMILDVTEDAKRLGFSPEVTYPALRDELVSLGRQYAFPRNTGVSLFFANRETFAKHNLPAPPWRWNADEFEALGRRFVAATNPPGARQRVFFANGVPRDVLRRGLGLSTFNETGTVCTLDDPRNVAVMARVRKWVVEDRLIPTKEEDAAMAADITGYGSMFSHFTSGRFAMIYSGHWAIMMIRPRGVFQLAAVEPPQDGFPNTEMGGGGIGVYAGTRHREESVRFMQFLASEPFNRLILKQADSLPPVPKYAETEEFLHPRGRENEWGVHGAFAQSGRETGILFSRSPFVLFSQTFRIEMETYEAMIAGRLTPAEAAKQMADRINTEIRLTVARNDRLRALYEERLELQRQIEARRAAGRPVPAAWVTDSFHRVYYQKQGWLEGEATP